MNSLPSVNALLALLDALRKNVSEITARQEKLDSDFRLGTAAEMRDFAARSEEQETAAHEREVNAAGTLKLEQDQCRARFECRKAWLNRAHSAVSRRVLKNIAEQDWQWKERAQQGVQQAEVRRDQALAAATADHEDLQLRLTEAGNALITLEASVRRAFGGYGRFRRLLAPDRPWPQPDLAADHKVLFAGLQTLQQKIAGELADFKKQPLPLLFRFLPLWLLTVILWGVAAADPVGAHFHKILISHLAAGLALAGFGVVAVIYFLGGRLAAPAAATLAGDLARARRLFEACLDKSAAHWQNEQARIKGEFDNTKQAFNQEWRLAVRDISSRRGQEPAAINEKAARIVARIERQRAAALERLQERQARRLADLKTADQAQFQRLAEAHENRVTQFESVYNHRWQELESDWKNRLRPLCEQLRQANDAAGKLCPPWEPELWENWTPPDHFQNAVRFGRLEGGVEKLVGPLPKDPRLPWFGPATLSAPLALVCPEQGSILFESGQTSGDEAFSAINNIIFRLLAATPPGKLSFTIFDPVGLGQNFAALTHLADYEESSINSRIWTQSGQFEEKLAELNEHMEKIIQMYLRNEYATIAEYNAEAGSVAEKYHFLVIASFPVNFTDTAARRLRNIAASGARCGVFTLIHWDQRNAVPQDFVPDELRKNSVCLTCTDGGFELSNWRVPGLRLLLDAPPADALATDYLQRVGELSRNSTRVEVPFETVAPGDADLWTEDTTEQLRVPIGRSGATKFQYLEIGSGTRQHALIAGKTGSGKSTLFHIIITNLALRCSPEQVEFYLVDFKKGVEFKCYGTRHLPHARVVAIESDREFGLSVLQRVDEELRRRGDLFRKLGAQDLPGYKRAGGTDPVPRTLLMIDEFQEFFTEEDRVSQGAAVLLDRIVRQGRAFGIHVILGSQTLGGAYTLARATIGQMVIRIALQCNEADAFLIMDQDNPAPRLLSRPGEGIYNDAAGAIEGNSPFQAVWLSDRTRDSFLEKIRARADQSGDQYPGPIVFEGNAPADVRENHLLREALSREPAQVPAQAAIWLGAPNSIKGPTEARFQRQSGSHLLVVGQSEERTSTLLAVALVALAAQYPKPAAQFYVFDSTPQGFPQREVMDRLIQSLPHKVLAVGNAEVPEAMATLAEELKQRGDNESAGPEIFVLIQGLQTFKKLRQEDEFSFSSSSGDAPNPAATLLSLITEGPSRGIHLILTCDTYNNVSRFLGRKALTDFEMRVVFQMSASDSASLIDAPAAGTLGLHRALLYNDREGSLETFRPYAQPGGEWLDEVVGKLTGVPA
ncbi:MAG: FtsK/SpoIIIE domain-containing protein [Verrucomicrobiota bacterium]